MPHSPVRALLLMLTACAVPAAAQQLIGYVPTRDATVTGSTDEVEGRAVLTGSASVTAKDRTAAITLGRGGTVRVCQTSVLHLTEDKAVSISAPLLLSLDRGAIEIDMNGTPRDSIMTPDLRFTVRNSGPLDLRLRVARNGDTCVDNRGAGAPTIAVSDPFGESMYELAAGQHVLFEHGSLHEVVDHETSACGCPAPAGMSVAEALVAPGSHPSSGPKTATPEKHPFPEAVSEGLVPTEATPAPPETLPPATPQIADALTYSAAMKDPDALETDKKPAAAATTTVTAPSSAADPTTSASATAVLRQAPQPAAPPAPTPNPAAAQPEPQAKDLVHVVGRFFRKMFRGH